MRLLNFASRFPGPSVLTTRRLILQRPHPDHYAAWAKLRRESADFLRPFEPKWARDELSRAAFRQRLRRQESEINAGRGLPWFLFEREDPAVLLGGLTLSNIRHGVADTATLGYWMGEAYAGKGIMREAVLTVCECAFRHHKLHRIEAATIIENERSQRLLESCGFQREGIARAYLKINDEWRDHHLFARLSTDPDVETPQFGS